MSLHYWRPDYTPEQARLVIEDYLDDLADFLPSEIERACMTFRRNPENKFFPKSGELLGILNAKSVWDTPPSRLPKFRSPPALTGPKPRLKSVGDVLRENGHQLAADKYETAIQAKAGGHE